MSNPRLAAPCEQLLTLGRPARCSPALYKAFHDIVNLSRLDEEVDETGLYQIVGPICETGDVLGRDRELPLTRPGDVLAIGLGGAYGAVMSSYCTCAIVACSLPAVCCSVLTLVELFNGACWYRQPAVACD